MRGAFLGGGSLTSGGSPHLELRTATPAAASLLRDVAAAHGVALGIVERASHAAAYAKSWEAIETLLALAGADEAVLELEERAVVAATRGQANRLANADHANLVRTSRASQDQLRAIERLRADGTLERLPAPFREVADLRRRHPTASLRELAERTDPRASRAAVHRRLRRLEELAGTGGAATAPR